MIWQPHVNSITLVPYMPITRYIYAHTELTLLTDVQSYTLKVRPFGIETHCTRVAVIQNFELEKQ